MRNIGKKELSKMRISSQNSGSLLISEKKAREFASSTFRDIPLYISAHKDEFSLWSNSDNASSDCESEVIHNE